MDLRSFYFADPRMFVVPIEHLSPAGMSEAHAASLIAERGTSEAWIQRFNEAVASYFARCRHLYARAPETWFPPRLQNVCIVTEPEVTRPYYQPFHQSSWLLYQGDFEPDTSSLELSSYLFAHIERFSLSRNIAAAVAHNLSWFLVLEEAEIASFVEGCQRLQRPDAAAFVALAEAMPWVRRIYHDKLKQPLLALPEPCGRIEAAELVVPMSLGDSLRALVHAFDRIANEAADRYFAVHARSRGDADALCDFLAQERPPVIVTGEDGATLWDPDEPDNRAALRRALDGVCAAAAESIRADLELVGDRSQRFLASLRDPAALPRPGDEIDQSGLSYIHRERKLIAYNLHDRELQRLREPAAPYERLMLAARSIHEWCHLAVDAGLVRVPPEEQERHKGALADLAALFGDLLDRAPGPLRAIAAQEVQALASPGQSPGEAMVAFFLRRMDDYLANVLARRFCAPEELETYLRQQVTTLAQEDLGPYAQLARYTYEFQYLGLGGIEDPLAYFLESTWFREHFVEAGIVTEARLAELFAAAGKLCAGYRIDDDAFNPPRS